MHSLSFLVAIRVSFAARDDRLLRNIRGSLRFWRGVVFRSTRRCRRRIIVFRGGLSLPSARPSTLSTDRLQGILIKDLPHSSKADIDEMSAARDKRWFFWFWTSYIFWERCPSARLSADACFCIQTKKCLCGWRYGYICYVTRRCHIS